MISNRFSSIGFVFVIFLATVFSFSVHSKESYDLIVSVAGGAASVTVMQVNTPENANLGKIVIPGGRQNKTVYAVAGQKIYIELAGGATRAYVDRRFTDDFRNGTLVIHVGGGGSFYEFF